jgi:hypothetical protein
VARETAGEYTHQRGVVVEMLFETCHGDPDPLLFPSLYVSRLQVGSQHMNLFNNLAGIIAPIAAGFIFDSTGSFAVNFIVAGVILVLGIISFLLLLGPQEFLCLADQIRNARRTFGSIKK